MRSAISGLLFLLTAVFSLEARNLSTSDFNPYDIENVTSIVSFSKDDEGKWVKQPEGELSVLPDSTEFMMMGKVSTTRDLYLLRISDIPGVILDGVVRIRFNKGGYKKYKDDEDIPEVTPEDMKLLIDFQTEELERFFQE